MINICTVSDYKYLGQGLTMYESLLKHTNNFRLFYLCIDDKTFDVIHKHESKNLFAFHIDEMPQEVLNLRNEEYKYFCWSLASYFTNFIMNSGKYSDINYVDSDIFFHDDFNIILDAIGEKSVGIFRHRQFDMNFPHDSGWFNVGILHFKNDIDGKTTLSWWSDAVLNKRYPELATCGDQRYLDAFLELGDNLFIDGNIGSHLPEGSISLLYYATRFMQIPLAIIAISAISII